VRFLDDRYVSEEPPIRSLTSDEQDIQDFGIVKRDHYYVVQARPGVDIGVIHSKTTKALQSIDEIGTVTYKAVSDARDFDRWMKTPKSKGKAADWNLEINICGPLAVKEKVSKLLSAARLYLQQPLGLERGLSVDNPHLITFPSLRVQSELSQLPTPLLTPEYSSASSPRDLSQVLEDLDQTEYLEPIDIDSRIATELLRYGRHQTSLKAQD
jgi:hypothetical protein